jgi:hypothetical protein
MPHELILKNVAKMPIHWQEVFAELRISMGMENAYRRIKELRGGIANA